MLTTTAHNNHSCENYYHYHTNYNSNYHTNGYNKGIDSFRKRTH